MIDFRANAAELNTVGKIFISSQAKQNEFRRPFRAEPLSERSEKIGTCEAIRKCNLVNGLPPRYRGEDD
jgi:hypothetical protein